MKKICDYHLKPNLCLILSSSLFCYPVISVYLKDSSLFYKRKNEMIYLIIVSIFSISRWSVPCYFFRKIDSFLAKGAYVYFLLTFISKKKQNHTSGILIGIIIYFFFYLSKYSRKRFFKKWYIFHLIFHLLSCFTITHLYYSQSIIL